MDRWNLPEEASLTGSTYLPPYHPDLQHYLVVYYRILWRAHNELESCHGGLKGRLQSFLDESRPEQHPNIPVGQNNRRKYEIKKGRQVERKKTK